jgi:hypothetical protein
MGQNAVRPGGELSYPLPQYQAQSQPLLSQVHIQSPPPPPHSQAYHADPLGHVQGAKSSQMATAGGNKLRRAFGSKSKSVPDPASELQHPPSPPPSRPKHLIASHLLGKKGNSQHSPPSSSPLPPLPPLLHSPPRQSSQQHNRGSIIPLSPTISSALAFIRRSEEAQKDGMNASENIRMDDPPVSPNLDSKEDWRKSDATVTAAGAHQRPPRQKQPRPVSVAESAHSAHTVVPSPDSVGMSPSSQRNGHSPRRPSFDLDDSSSSSPSPPSSSPSTPSFDSNNTHRPPNRTAMYGHPGFYPPFDPNDISDNNKSNNNGNSNRNVNNNSGGNNSGSTTNLRGRWAAWTANVTTFSSSSSSLSSTPMRGHQQPPQPQPQGPVMQQSQPPPRPTAVSLTGPTGLAKRAVEKMGRAWGGISHGSNSSMSSHSGYSSSSSTSTTSPSSYSSNASTPAHHHHQQKYPRQMHPQQQQQSQQPAHLRRTPNGPSGAWSISTEGDVTNSQYGLAQAVSDGPRSGPYLGLQLRAPIVTSGAVFGRDLHKCTRETAIRARWTRDVLEDMNVGAGADAREAYLRSLEKRMVPAIVVRCAQHLLLWGVQEEGLFR